MQIQLCTTLAGEAEDVEDTALVVAPRRGCWPREDRRERRCGPGGRLHGARGPRMQRRRLGGAQCGCRCGRRHHWRWAVGPWRRGHTVRDVVEPPHLRVKAADHVAGRIVAAGDEVAVAAGGGGTPHLGGPLPHYLCKMASGLRKSISWGPLLLFVYPQLHGAGAGEAGADGQVLAVGAVAVGKDAGVGDSLRVVGQSARPEERSSSASKGDSIIRSVSTMHLRDELQKLLVQGLPEGCHTAVPCTWQLSKMQVSPVTCPCGVVCVESRLRVSGTAAKFFSRNGGAQSTGGAGLGGDVAKGAANCRRGQHRIQAQNQLAFMA